MVFPAAGLTFHFFDRMVEFFVVNYCRRILSLEARLAVVKRISILVQCGSRRILCLSGYMLVTKSLCVSYNILYAPYANPAYVFDSEIFRKFSYFSFVPPIGIMCAFYYGSREKWYSERQ